MHLQQVAKFETSYKQSFFSYAKRSTNVRVKIQGTILLKTDNSFIIKKSSMHTKQNHINILVEHSESKNSVAKFVTVLRFVIITPDEDGGHKARLLIVCKSVGMSSIMSAASAEHPNPCDTTNNPHPTHPAHATLHNSQPPLRITTQTARVSQMRELQCNHRLHSFNIF